MQVHFLPILTQGQKRNQREVELVAASARSHAAKVTHLRRARNRKGLKAWEQKFSITEYCSEVDKHRPDSSITEVCQHNLQSPAPLVFKGRSDPFSSFGFHISAELNSIITFTRETGLPSMFRPLYFRLTSTLHPQRTLDEVGKMEMGFFLSSIYASFSDEGTALAKLIMYGNIMCKCINNRRHLKLLTLQMRSRSIKLLEEKVAHYDATSECQAENLRQHILSLLHAHALEGDVTGSRTHAIALRELVDPETVGVFTMSTLLHISVSAAMISGQRTISEIDDWCLIPLMRFLTDFRDINWGLCEELDIHHNVTLPVLRKVFERRWHSLTQIWPPRCDTTFLFGSIATNVDFCLLHNLYYDLIECKIMSESSVCERTTQAALAIALLYLHRRLHGDITIAGTDRSDISQIHMAYLQHSLTLAFESSNGNDRILFREAWLWALYVGALCEHHRGRESQKQMFQPTLALLARSVKITSWSEMQNIAEKFFHFALIDPEEAQWFEALIADQKQYECLPAPWRGSHLSHCVAVFLVER